MSTKQILTPDASHPIAVTHNPNEIVVKVGEQVIAQSRNTVTVREANYPAVHYIPREDVEMTLLVPTDHETYCPYKGDCSYFSIVSGKINLPNAVWCYENPYAPVAEIKGHLAFYTTKVDLIESA